MMDVVLQHTQGVRKSIMKHKNIITMATLFIPTLLAASYLLQVYEVRHLQPEMQLGNLSDLDRQRIVFHSFETPEDTNGVDYDKDHDFAELLFITAKKVYLFKDGFDIQNDVKQRRTSYKAKLLAWGKQRNIAKKLIEIFKKRERAKKISGTHSLSYKNFDNSILMTLQQSDAKLRRLKTESKQAEEKINLIEQNLGKNSPEYRNQKELVAKRKQKADQREQELRHLLTLAATDPASATVTKEEKVAVTTQSTDKTDKLAQEGQEGETQAPKSSLQEATQAPKSSSQGESQTPKLSLSEIEDKGPFEWLAKPPELKGAGIYLDKPNGKPDYVLISNARQRSSFLQKADNEYEQWVSNNYTSLYQDLRDRHIQRYVDRYRALLFYTQKYKSKVTTSLAIDEPLCKRTATPKEQKVETQEQAQTTTYDKTTSGASDNSTDETKQKASILDKAPFRRVDIHAIEGSHYTALDCNHDGITETFLVYEANAFHWHTRGIPNVISIFNNTDKKIQTIIGNLVQIAHTGNIKLANEIEKEQGDIQEYIQKKIQIEEKLRMQQYE